MRKDKRRGMTVITFSLCPDALGALSQLAPDKGCRSLTVRQLLIDAASKRQMKPSTALFWYRQGQFPTEDAARAAFELAYQQGLDGCGESVAGWMGLTSEEFAGWMRSRALPPLNPARAVKS